MEKSWILALLLLHILLKDTPFSVAAGLGATTGNGSGVGIGNAGEGNGVGVGIGGGGGGGFWIGGGINGQNPSASSATKLNRAYTTLQA